MRIHLVDGTWELFRAHFGAPPHRDAEGREVGAVRGLLRSLHALVAREGVTHLACAFDSRIESFRNELFSSYKTSAGVPAELLAQFPLAEEACEALGVVTWGMWEFEADDAMATAAARLASLPEVDQVVLASPDKDLSQCIQGDRVIQWDRQRGRTLDEAGVRERFGVGPELVPDWLALVGDAADGIPGLPGWGPKSAAAVLAAHGRIEEIPDDPAGWKAKVRGAERLAVVLRERRQEALLYRRLATLRTDVPLRDLEPEALRWRGADRERLERICATIGERGLLTRIARWR